MIKKQIHSIYTKTGDKGITKTLSGQTVPKNHCLIQINGELDSLQASIDKLIAFSKYSQVLSEQKELLKTIQMLLWQLGGEISQKQTGRLVKRPIKEKDVKELEHNIDSFALDLMGFQRFTNLVSVDVNETRVRTRSFERTLTNYLEDAEIRYEVYQYINRLSDYFFALAVTVEKEGSTEE